MSRQRSTVTTEGYTLHDGRGRIVAYAEHADVALKLLRTTRAAETVRRVSDEELIATKHWLGNDSVFAWLAGVGQAAAS